MSITSTRVELGSEQIWLEVWEDRNGDPLVVSSDLLPLQPQLRLTSIAVYHATSYTTTFPDAGVRNTLDKVNSSEWRGWEAGEAWVSGFGAEPVETSDGDRFKVHVTVSCMRGGWAVKVPNAGHVYKATSGDFKSFVDSDGNRYTGNLNTDGDKAETLNVIEFDCAEEVDFATVLSF